MKACAERALRQRSSRWRTGGSSHQKGGCRANRAAAQDGAEQVVQAGRDAALGGWSAARAHVRVAGGGRCWHGLGFQGEAGCGWDGDCRVAPQGVNAGCLSDDTLGAAAPPAPGVWRMCSGARPGECVVVGDVEGVVRQASKVSLTATDRRWRSARRCHQLPICGSGPGGEGRPPRRRVRRRAPCKSHPRLACRLRSPGDRAPELTGIEQRKNRATRRAPALPPGVRPSMAGNTGKLLFRQPEKHRCVGNASTGSGKPPLRAVHAGKAAICNASIEVEFRRRPAWGLPCLHFGWGSAGLTFIKRVMRSRAALCHWRSATVAEGSPRTVV